MCSSDLSYFAGALLASILSTPGSKNVTTTVQSDSGLTVKLVAVELASGQVPPYRAVRPSAGVMVKLTNIGGALGTMTGTDGEMLPLPITLGVMVNCAEAHAADHGVAPVAASHAALMLIKSWFGHSELFPACYAFGLGTSGTAPVKRLSLT